MSPRSAGVYVRLGWHWPLLGPPSLRDQLIVVGEHDRLGRVGRGVYRDLSAIVVAERLGDEFSSDGGDCRGSLSVGAAAALAGREDDGLFVSGSVAALEEAEAALDLEDSPHPPVHGHTE
jgi:hypothetical protein